MKPIKKWSKFVAWAMRDNCDTLKSRAKINEILTNYLT